MPKEKYLKGISMKKAIAIDTFKTDFFFALHSNAIGKK